MAELALGEKFYEEAAFHAQQAAEKALKALISATGTRPPKTHDIDVLLEILQRAGVDRPSEELSSLTAYAVEARYPGPPIVAEEAGEALRVAERAVEWVRGKLEEMGIKC